MSTPAPPRSSDAWIALQFTLAGVVWGASFLFIALALEGLSPVQVATGRTLFGAITLGLIALVTRDRLPRSGRVWAHLLLLSVTFAVIPYMLFAWAQQYVASGVASIFNATTPIMTALIAGLAFRIEKLTREQVLGIVVGIIGVVVIVGPWQGIEPGSGGIVPYLALLGATACYGFSLSYMRRFLADSGVSAIVFSFVMIGLAAVWMLLLTPVIGADPVTLTPTVIIAIVLLGALGTGLAYAWNQNVVRAWGPTRAATVTYISPPVGVLLGVLVLGETLVWNEPVGAVLVILGVLLAQRRLRLPSRRPRETPDGA
ncbi:MAG: EamA family transporter [Micrococcales bacterium 32-70-13]|nr:MAG: EamA family transporter [Micrococcales bacterium 32-70-13]